MNKEVHLKDGTDVLIRQMKEDDIERSVAFFRKLPDEDRKYLRVDVSKRDIVEKRIREIDHGRVERIVAIIDDEIVADGALELTGDEWTSHLGEVRLIVARGFQRKGLGMLMAWELYAVAASHKVEQMVVRMARPQVAARTIFRKLGFREEITLPNLVRDRTGATQDLVIMRCDLEGMWQELEDFFGHGDWQRAR